VFLYHWKEQPTVKKRLQWDRLQWFGHVRRIDDFCLQKNDSIGKTSGWLALSTQRAKECDNDEVARRSTSRRIYPGAFTVTLWRRPPAWQLSTAHGGGCGTTSPASTDVVTNQASAHIQMSRTSLYKRRFDTIAWCFACEVLSRMQTLCKCRQSVGSCV